MRAIVLFIAASVCFLLPAAGRTKASKEVPQASETPLPSSDITLDAFNIAAGRAQGLDIAPQLDETRITTAHTETVQITICNIGTAPETVALRWFWVGRYEKSKNWFRSGDGGQTITIYPKQSQIILAENGEIEGHLTKGAEHYKSGGNMLGWIVTASNSGGELLAIKASDPIYEGFAQSPPARQRHSSVTLAQP